MGMWICGSLIHGLGCVAGATAAGASVELTSVPALGSQELLRGRVTGVDPAKHRVAVCIAVFGGWWTKPSWAQPATMIQADSGWTCDIYTGGADGCASHVAAFVVPADYGIPLLGGEPVLPAGLEKAALARVLVTREDDARRVEFSGYSWAVKHSGDCAWGPGPNYFADRGVGTDGQGRLVLEVANRSGRWESAEVILLKALGYGTYRFQVDTALDMLDPSVVFGMFTWSNDAMHHHREIDVEFSNGPVVGRPRPWQFVVQPYDVAGHRYRYALGFGAAPSWHEFVWTRQRVAFASGGGLLANRAAGGVADRAWVYSGAGVPPPGDATIRMNLWLHDGQAPGDGRAAEVAVSRFEFVPVAPELRYVRRDASGIEFEILSESSVMFVVETSADLRLWHRLATLDLPHGTSRFVDRSVGGEAGRYYRLVAGP